MAEATFSEIVGAAVRAKRQEWGLSQDEVAQRCGQLGFIATRSVIASIERGARQLELPELLALLAALGLSLERVLASADRVQVDGGFTVATKSLRGQLTDELAPRPNSWRVSNGESSFTVTPVAASVRASGFGLSPGALKAFVGGFSDAEMKAARKLGVEPRAVADAAEQLWGRSLTAERETRVAGRLTDDTTARGAQALRGHVTRDLTAELSAALHEGGES